MIYHLYKVRSILRKGKELAGTFISVYEYVTLCCIRMNPSVINFGNIFDSDKLTNIWWCRNYIKFRLSILKDTFNPICDLCPD